jgi:type IV secretory pathway VirB10-like protein
MSLINDALKRAREAQDHGPSATTPPPQFRPADAPRQPHFSPIYFIVGMGMLVIVLGLLLVWQLAQRRDMAQRVQARAQEIAAAKSAESERPAMTKAPTPVPASKPVPAVPAVAANIESPPAPASSAAVPSKTPEPGSPSAPQTLAAVPEAPAKAPALKLQGITFHPTRPAAMISGRTLFIGDRTGDWRVIAITQETATLVNGTRTNVLTLPE